MRAALYIRVSTDEQSERGFSIPDQKRDLTAYVEREGWTLIETVVDDGYSGAVGSRPGLDRVMALAEAGRIDVVLAKKRNRLFRNRYYRLIYEKSLKELGVSLVALDDTGNRFADAMTDEFADWYREELAKNTQMGRLQKAREGRLIAAPNPIYGYQYTDSRDGYLIDAPRMAVVERIFREVAGGKSLYGVKKALKESSTPSPRGAPVWGLKTLREMVAEDVYKPVTYAELAPLLTPSALSRIDEGEEYGVVWYPKRKVSKLDPNPERGYRRSQRTTPYPKEERIPIPVPASGIPREVVDAAREAIADNPVIRSNGHRVYELAGRIRCALCNNALTTGRKLGGKRTYFYYRCPRYQRDGHAGCSMNHSLRAEETERTVLEAVLDVVKDREELIRKARDDYEAQRKQLLDQGADPGRGYRRLQAIEEERLEYFRQGARGRLTDEQIDTLVTELETERTAIEKTIQEYENRDREIKRLKKSRDATIDLIRAGRWRDLGITRPEARRERYREIGLSVLAHPDGTLNISWAMGTKKVTRSSECLCDQQYYVRIERRMRGIG